MMSGETNLEILLASMEPVLDKQPFGFVTVPHAEVPLSAADIFACIHEVEGMTLVAPVDVLQRHNITCVEHWAKISLTVHSSLSAVGLTAAFAKALGDNGVSANVVAGYFHDHIFVQWQLRHDAMEALATFKK
jgi:uncharacterized protein